MATPERVAVDHHPEDVRELDAGEDMTPGEIAEYDGSGGIQAHSTAGGEHNGRLIVLARESKQETIDTTISSGDTLRFTKISGGLRRFRAFLASGENVSKGDRLESDGSGALQAHGTNGSGEEDAVCRAAEDLDNSGGGSRTRILVEEV